MLNLELYEQTRLHARPLAHRAIAECFLRFDYRKVALRIEGLERVPDGPVIYAMNHTDAFNYWPFQYQLHKAESPRYTATWVKGKNYEGGVASRFMRSTNNIPLASRGYLITRDFLNTVGRLPNEDEYRVLRDAIDCGGVIDGGVPESVPKRARDMLGRRFEPSRETYAEAMQGLMTLLMERFVKLNRYALETLGLDVLVFPQGSRSRRLSQGHIGLAQVALHLGATIVPVGCSGSDEVYDSRSIVAKPGAITYRIGAPMPAERWAQIAPKEPFVPFSTVAESEHREAFQTVVDEVMACINDLVDEPYRFLPDKVSTGTAGLARFI